MIFEWAASTVSLLFCLLPAVLLLRTGAVFIPTHLLFLAMFVPGLHLANLVSDPDRTWQGDYYMAAHLSWMAYAWGVYLMAVGGRRLLLSDRSLVDQVRGINDNWIAGAFLAWIALKLYLIAKYGILAFATYRELAGPDESLFRFASWETALEQYAVAFATGASAAWAIKAAAIPGYWKRPWPLSAMLAFMLPFLVALESPLGTRRFILILVVVGALVLLNRHSISAWRFVVKRWRHLALLATLTLGIAMYYQTVRRNYYEPEVAALLTSSSLIEILEGAGMALIPRFGASSATDDGAGALINRDGPFELTYEIVRELCGGNPGTRGEIMSISLNAVLPRAISGENKEQVTSDDVINERMSVTPRFSRLIRDLSTSLPSIFISDFGVIGVAIAPAVFVLCVGAVLAISRLRWTRGGPWNLLWLGLLILMVGSVENDLVSYLSIVRNALIALTFAILLAGFRKAVKPVRLATRTA